MSPKYRGDSEDWLDSSDSRRSGRKPAKDPTQNLYSEGIVTNAVITEVYPDLCQVQIDAEAVRRLCTYRRSLFQKRGRFRSPVSVGDRVKVTVMGQKDAVLEGIEKPLNRLQRLAPGEEDNKPIHVMGSNLDQVAVVASSVQPRFVTGLVDRVWLAARSFEIPVILLVTKLDLEQEGRHWDIYEGSPIHVLEVSSKTGLGIDALKKILEGKRTAIVGHSGVGKTSLLRNVLNQEVGRIQEVNEFTGKGRHTTTSSILYTFGVNSTLIDTPGVREFDLAEISQSQVESWLPELVNELKVKSLSDFSDRETGTRLAGLYRLWSELVDAES